MQQQAAALYVARGGALTFQRAGERWAVLCGAETLRGRAGGVFTFTSPASAANWLEAAALKLIGLTWSPESIGKYTAKVETCRLAAKKAGNVSLEAELQAEIDAMLSVSGASLRFDGGGASLDTTAARYNRLEGGRP